MHLNHQHGEKWKSKGKKPLINQVTRLQYVFIVCCICRRFTLWPLRIIEGNLYWASYFTSFFPSRSPDTLFLPVSLLPPPPPLYPPPLPPPPSPFSLSLSPSPIPLSQLPVELAAIQHSADGSVIRSASLHSLFSSPLFFLSFSLCLIKLQKKTSVHLDLSIADAV